ncbi:MAG: glycosyltransferase family 39 protein [Odoribacter sp.]
MNFQKINFLRYLFLFSCFIPLLWFRDFTPNNELKYLSIADEAIRNGHFFTFWNHGVMYADKPPLYFWIVMLGKWLLGCHSMFFLSLFSIIPALVILYVMDKWVRGVDPKIASSGQLMLMTSGLFAGSAIVLRMDMLMSMFIVLALYTFYRQYVGNAVKYASILLPVYIFLAVFTKGPVGVLVPLLSISCFLLLKGQIRHFGRYFGWKQFGILVGLCLCWFSGVYLEGGKSYLNNLLFHQTVNRAIDSFHHKEPLWYYLKTIWYSLAPWILLYATTIIWGIKKQLIDNDLKKLFVVVITTTFIALSIFSGKLDIYLLPIFPFIAYLAFILLPDLDEKYIRWTVVIPGVILFLSFPGLFIIARYIDLPILQISAIPVAAFLLSVSSGICLYLLFKKRLVVAANTISIGLLMAILTGGFAISGLNSYIGYGEICQKGETIAQECGIKNFYFYQLSNGKNMDAYLQTDINKVDISGISSLVDKQKFILFVSDKNLKEEVKLQQIVNNNKVYTIGKYSFIVFN